MRSWRRAVPRGTGRLALLTALLTICLLLPGPAPVSAASSGQTNLFIGATVLGVVFTPLIAYGIYRNLPSQQGQEEKLFPGEFYVGGYMGASFSQSQNLKYENGAVLNNGVNLVSVPPFTLANNRFETGVVGGLKFGYFLKSLPYLGFELDMNFAPNRVRSRTVTASPPVLGSNAVTLSNDNWVNWTTAGHIVGRYGFLKDREVPFGRLQPYAGIGPGFVVMYDQDDAAKNFSIDVMAGLRYMMLKNVSAFVEYKFDYQFDTEMELHRFTAGGFVGRGTAHLPFANHKVVVGVAYHF